MVVLQLLLSACLLSGIYLIYPHLLPAQAVPVVAVLFVFSQTVAHLILALNLKLEILVPAPEFILLPIALQDYLQVTIALA
jgi:hypothetical protein